MSHTIDCIDFIDRQFDDRLTGQLNPNVQRPWFAKA